MTRVRTNTLGRMVPRVVALAGALGAMALAPAERSEPAIAAEMAVETAGPSGEVAWMDGVSHRRTMIGAGLVAILADRRFSRGID